MFKSIKNSIIILMILVLVTIIPYIIISIKYDDGIEKVQESSIVIYEDGKIKVTDEIILKSDESKTVKQILLPRSLYVKDESNTYWDICKEPQNIEVYLNDKLLENNNFRKQIKYYVSDKQVEMKDVNIPKNIEQHIKINYEYDTIDAVEEYNNLAVLRLMTDEEVSKSNIKIQLPQKTNLFELKPSAKMKYLGNNIYNISGKLKTPYTEVLIDKGVIENTKIVNEEYEVSDIKRTLNKEDKFTISILIVFATITLVNFITIMVLTTKTKKQKRYVRNPEEVIEPILAESIIDRKIGAKELIMSCIVELVRRGNLKSIGNEQVELVNTDYISEYEQEILGLIFKEKGQIVTFNEIKEMFIENNNETQEFFNKFKIIKKKIEEKLFDYHIYSKIGERILKILKIISIVILIDILYILFIIINPAEKLVFVNIVKNTLIALGGTIAIIIFNVDFTEIVRSSSNNIKFKMGLISLLILSIISLIYEGYKHIGVILIIIAILILNIIILIKTKTHILTKTGKIELEKAQGLKDYIIDYSLMEEKDIESVIIWEEYLAYAVAFGIPNKITAKFDEKLMNANIIVQKIEEILKM